MSTISVRASYDQQEFDCTHANVQDPTTELCSLLDVSVLQGFDLLPQRRERDIGSLGRFLDGSERDLHGERKLGERFGGERNEMEGRGEKEGRKQERERKRRRSERGRSR